MSKYIEVIAIVEGKTEQTFIESILAPYLGHRNIGIRATQVSKPGQKGGDVRFERVQKDIGLHLKQRADTYVTTFIDYYGTKQWPGLDEISDHATPEEIATTINAATKSEVSSLFPKTHVEKRFIPFVAVHEFEALLFCDPEILAAQLDIEITQVTAIIEECGSPEQINNSRETAPSKRLNALSSGGKFGKTTVGIAIARDTGIDTIRTQCPLFNTWLETLESKQEESDD